MTAVGANNPVYFEVGTAAGLDDLYASTLLLVNMIGTVADWTDVSGPGTVTTDAANQTITIDAVGGTPTLVRRSFTVVAGKNYRLSWTTSGTTCASALGNTLAGEQYKGLGTQHDPLGDNNFIFLTSSAALWVQFQRTNAGSCFISNLALEQLD